MITTGAKLRIAAIASVAMLIAATVGGREDAAVTVSEPVERVARTGAALNARSHARSPVNSPHESEASPSDPFAPRGWHKPVEPVEITPVVTPTPVATVTVPEPPPAPVAPTLPYAFMGQFDDGGHQVIYLSRNDQTFVVTQGDTLEGTYKVLAIDPARIELEHIATGTKQVLDIPASNN